MAVIAHNEYEDVEWLDEDMVDMTGLAAYKLRYAGRSMSDYSTVLGLITEIQTISLTALAIELN